MRGFGEYLRLVDVFPSVSVVLVIEANSVFIAVFVLLVHDRDAQILSALDQS